MDIDWIICLPEDVDPDRIGYVRSPHIAKPTMFRADLLEPEFPDPWRMGQPLGNITGLPILRLEADEISEGT